MKTNIKAEEDIEVYLKDKLKNEIQRSIKHRDIKTSEAMLLIEYKSLKGNNNAIIFCVFFTVIFFTVGVAWLTFNIHSLPWLPWVSPLIMVSGLLASKPLTVFDATKLTRTKLQAYRELIEDLHFTIIENEEK